MPVKAEFKIIADHLRSSCFLIADGILPSNEGRGYVLRRIMRRAMRQLHKLGVKEVMMYKLVDSLIKEMGTAYPELSRARDVIIETLKNEEEKFRETLEKGLKILEEEMKRITGRIGHSTSSQEIFKLVSIPGTVAFKLYDTYGFPLDLTQNIVEERGFIVDLEEFESEMEKQRERARKNWVGSGEEKEDGLFLKLKEKFGETKFLGYETLESKAKVLEILEISNDQKIIILNQTPFYATSGGQKGDDGKIIFGKEEIEIFETRKFAGSLFAHFTNKTNADLKVGDEVIAKVNQENRQARACNHSATHLMHKSLKEVLGNSISQKGSNVDANYFTFDFNFNRAMTAQEIEKVEELVNSQIKKLSNVNTKLMDLEEARNSGAEALFGEKYDAEVRVVSMGNSIELCGGTHVKNTSEIEIFKIISEKSIASGIRRIEAKAANAAKKYLEEQKQNETNKILELKEKIRNKDQEIFKLNNVKTDQSYLQENDQKILEEILKKKDKEIESLIKQALTSEIANLKSENIGDKIFIYHSFDNVDGKIFREIANDIKNKSDYQKNTVIALFNISAEMANVTISISSDLTKNLNGNNLLKAINSKGGGKPDFVTGGGLAKSDIVGAIETIKNSLK
ncbi:MAG: alanine--tRNA ligase [Rickettsiales bacterium]|nr:alanine--tRNA ligase [Rickettsiales bacterium]